MERSHDVTLLYLVKQVELAVRSHLDDAVGSAGLTSLQYTALTVLERHPGGVTSAELARNSFVRAQTMAQTIGYLGSRDLIVRALDPQSRRQYLLSLSPAGAVLLDELREPVAEIELKLLEGMSTEERETFRSLLRRARLALAGRHPH